MTALLLLLAVSHLLWWGLVLAHVQSRLRFDRGEARQDALLVALEAQLLEIRALVVQQHVVIHALVAQGPMERRH